MRRVTCCRERGCPYFAVVKVLDGEPVTPAEVGETAFEDEDDWAGRWEVASMPAAPGLAPELPEVLEVPSYTGDAAERELIGSAIRSGQTDVNQLANLVFFRRHPERNQRLLSRSEPNYRKLGQEWPSIRDNLVLPALRAGTPRAAPSTRTPAPTGPPTGGGTGGFENGRIPARSLCPIRTAPFQLLDCAAAQAFDRMNTAFRARFGVDITVNDAYRSYERQVEMKRHKGNLAAKPGTSNHGWGKAVDLGGTNNGVGAVFDWLTTNATTFGWMHPPWARPGGSKPESWHWEYIGTR
jgi:hypothetical protein